MHITRDKRTTGTRVALALVAVAVVAAACSSSNSSPSAAKAEAGNSGTPAAHSKGPPTLDQVEQAIESTGVSLCGDLNQGDVSYQVIQQSFGSTCTPDTADADVRIWDDASDPSTARASLQSAKSLNAGPIWADGLFVVEDESPPPGLAGALAKLGFQNITG